MRLVFIPFLFMPTLTSCQNIPIPTYQEGLDNCQRIAEEKHKANPDILTYSGPECIVGSRAPEFSTLTLDGAPFTTNNLQGKITILNFWMISCPPCIAEIPGLNNVVSRYGRQHFNFIAAGMDDEKDIREFLMRHPWHFDQLASGSTIILDLFKMRWGFPTTYVIDQDGVIIAAFSGGKPDERAVKEIEEKLSGIIDEALK